MKTLTRKEIAVLYGYLENAPEVKAFGARVSMKPTKRTKRRELTYEEIRTFKPARPAARELVSDVIEREF